MFPPGRYKFWAAASVDAVLKVNAHLGKKIFPLVFHGSAYLGTIETTNYHEYFDIKIKAGDDTYVNNMRISGPIGSDEEYLIYFRLSHDKSKNHLIYRTYRDGSYKLLTQPKKEVS